jgi:uncharacterized protein
MNHVVRVIAHWALLAHVYVSMAGFTLAFLFGVTGLTLNHQEFGFAEPQLSTSVINVNKALVDNPDQSAIEQCLRQTLGIRSRATDYHEDEDQIQITFAVPGARTVVTINRVDGRGEVEKESRGLLGKLDDLHKGLDVGKVWYSTIDVAALLLIISSLTGILTMLALRARRRTGFTVCALGVLTVILIYVIYVPR